MPIEMNIDDVARLARLALSEAEREQFSRQLANILTYVEKLKAVPTENVSPTQHILPIQNVTRPDEVKPSLDPASVLNHAPVSRDGFFIVPPIIE